jgi:putative spermidine/putrescine transport system permease protein
MMALPSHATSAEWVWYYALRFLVALTCIFLVAPIFVVIPLSFNAEPYFTFPMRGYSLQWYRDLFTSESWRHAAYNSLIVGVSTTCASTILGTLAALGLNRTNFALKGFVTGLLISPIIVPVIITAVGTYFFMSELGIANSRLGLIFGHIVLASPFVVVTVTAALTGLDRNLVRAGASLGAGPIRVFFHVVMPLIMPGVIAGAIFAFVTSFDETVLALFLSGPDGHTLPREMWKGIRQQINPVILCVSSLLVLISLLILAGMEVARRRLVLKRGPGE